jgi:hypothetical protein
MTNRQSGRAIRESNRSGNFIAQSACLLLLTGSILVGAFVWLLPVEVVQQWAVNRAGTGPFDRFEAVGQAEFALWLVRFFFTLLPVVIWYVWTDISRWRTWIVAVWHGLSASTSPSSTADITVHRSFSDRARTIGCRAALTAWMLLFAFHFIHGIGERMHEWPYFRFNSGEVVLPNISDSNRAVIRYLQHETPPNARILVASDQKLFFLSYYLRPRTLLHRMHPDSEHVIPLKDQQRRLNAYRLTDLTESDLAQMPHDYTLEYFEHPDLVDPSQILDDTNWISFVRQRERNPRLIPQYVVRLRKAGGTPR